MMTDISHVDLTTLPSDIWHELSSYLDTGDFISLAAVNQSLRRTITSDYPLLSSLLRHRMNLKYSSRNKRTPYEEIVYRIPSRRCDGCGGMESKPSLIKWNAMFQKGLCSDCRRSQKFKMITQTRAISEYQLDHSDLSPLRFSYAGHSFNLKRRPYYYALVDVQEVSRAKFAARGTTFEDEKRKAEERRQERILHAVNERRRNLIWELGAYGLEMDEDDPSMSGFIEHRATNDRPKLQDVVQQAVRRHYLDHHIPLEEMIKHVENFGYNGRIEDRSVWSVGRLQTVAFGIIAKWEKEWVRNMYMRSDVCECGQKRYFQAIFDKWCDEYDV